MSYLGLSRCHLGLLKAVRYPTEGEKARRDSTKEMDYLIQTDVALSWVFTKRKPSKGSLRLLPILHGAFAMGSGGLWCI